jgi:pimeloyl-ACP methyl ester carboxylesterase
MNGRWLDTTRGLGQRGRVDEARARTREGIAFLDVQGMRVRVLRRPAPGKMRVVFAADGPNTLEHYDALLAQLHGRADVTVFDFFGTGCSEPGPDFGFSVLEFASVLQGVLAQVVPAPEQATLVLPCYTGMFGLAAARADASRISRLVLSQTPSFRDFAAWPTGWIPSGACAPRCWGSS